MKLSSKGKLLRIFLGGLDKVGHKPLYEVLVMRARDMGLAGATVLRSVEGYGVGTQVIHTAKILRLSEDLPIVVELVDTEENIKRFLPIVNELFEKVDCGGMVTIENAEMIKHVHGSQSTQKI